MTALDPSYIQDNECQGVTNAIMLDGSVRLDQRYIGVCNPPTVTGDVAVSGSGYGKYGTEEEYIVAITGDLYIVDLTSGTLVDGIMRYVYTKLLTSHYAGTRDWFFQQFNDYIYGVSRDYGFGRTLIGSNTWTKLVNPTAPAAAPVIAPNLLLLPTFSTNVLSLAGSTFGGSPAGTDLYTAGTGWRRTYGSTQDGPLQFDVTLAAPVDFSYVDLLRLFMPVPNTVNWQVASVRLIIGGTYSSEAIIWNSFNLNNTIYTDARLSNISRTSRLAVQGFSIVLNPDRTVPSGSAVNILFPFIYGVWQTIDSQSNPGSGDPTFQPLTYEYTYYNSTTGLESMPSPAATLPASSQGKYGQWMNVTVLASAESGVNKIRIYRVVTNPSDGSVTRYRLTELNNVGATFVDKLPLEEVEALPIFTPFQIPTSGYTAIAAWQDRLVVAANGIVYISREGDPLSFTPLGTVFDPTDPARARTFYADDSRSETILGLCARDALYIVMDRSIRSLYGSSIDDWRLTRQPEAEGAYGPLSWAPYRNGVLVHTSSFRLLYVDVSQIAPEEVSHKLRVRIASFGLGASKLVGVRPNGEIEVRRHNDSGPSTHSYRIMDTQGRWRGGNHFDESHSLLFIPGLPIRWVGVNGKIYEGGDDAFQDDDGQPVTWSVQTKDFLLERSKVDHIYIGETVCSGPDPDDTKKALYPRVTIYSENVETVIPDWGDKWLHPTQKATGATISLLVEGDKDTVLRRFEYETDRRSDAKNK